MIPTFEQLHAYIIDADRIVPLLCAILLTVVIGMITGPMFGNANPLLWGVFDKIFGRVGDRIDKPKRKKSDLVFRGLVFSIVVLIVSMLLGYAAIYIIKDNFYLHVLAVSLCLTSGAVWFITLRLYFALSQNGKADGAYYSLSTSSRTNLNSVDDFGITREGIAFSAISFDKGMIAPSLWYLIGGLPTMLIYTGVAFMMWRFSRYGTNNGFASVMSMLEKLMAYPASLFSGFIFTAAAAVTPSASIKQAFLSWWSAKEAAPYEQHGITLSAMAWPLGLSLGGPVQDIAGVGINKNWIGPEGASAQIVHQHLKRAIVMNVLSHLLFVLALLSAYIFAGKYGF